MGLILIGILFCIPGFIIFKRVLNDKTEKLYIVKCFVSALCCVMAIFFVSYGFCGIRIEEGTSQLKDTQYVTLQNKDELKYEVFDEENNILYYFEKSEVEVLKNGRRGMYGNKIMFDCAVVTGDYAQPYIEVYEIDYKMNFWSLELTNATEYILYIPA